MRLIADSVDAIPRLARMLDIPDDVLYDTYMTDREYIAALDDYGLSVSMTYVRRFRGTDY
jgi:hypothetical protein